AAARSPRNPHSATIAARAVLPAHQFYRAESTGLETAPSCCRLLRRHSQTLQQRCRREPFDARLSEVVVVRPHRDPEVKCQGPHVDVIGIASPGALGVGGNLPGVLGSLAYGHWQ